jgi:hypothetical protein
MLSQYAWDEIISASGVFTGSVDVVAAVSRRPIVLKAAAENLWGRIFHQFVNKTLGSMSYPLVVVSLTSRDLPLAVAIGLHTSLIKSIALTPEEAPPNSLAILVQGRLEVDQAKRGIKMVEKNGVTVLTLACFFSPSGDSVIDSERYGDGIILTYPVVALIP